MPATAGGSTYGRGSGSSRGGMVESSSPLSSVELGGGAHWAVAAAPPPMGGPPLPRGTPRPRPLSGPAPPRPLPSGPAPGPPRMAPLLPGGPAHAPPRVLPSTMPAALAPRAIPLPLPLGLVGRWPLCLSLEAAAAPLTTLPGTATDVGGSETEGGSGGSSLASGLGSAPAPGIGGSCLAENACPVLAVELAVGTGGSCLAGN